MDSAIWSSAYTRSYAVRKVQKSLDMLEGWCRRWRVKLNGEKSKFMFIERLKSPDGENHCLHLFNDIIRPTNQAKFLGIEIDDKLVFKKHFEAIVSKSLKHINVLRLLSRSNVKPKTLVQLYKTYIRPIIEYGSFCFLAAPKQNMSMLEKIQNQALRICLHLPSYIRTSLLHEYASIKTLTDRLHSLNKKLLTKMSSHSADIKNLVDNYNDAENAFESAKTPLEVLFCLCR